MENRYARLAQIHLNNVKNVIDGGVEFESIKSFNPYDKKKNSSVFAIYGSNASGKTTMVESISVAHDLMIGNKVGDMANGFITQWKKESRCNFVFIVEGASDEYYLAEYAFSFIKNDQVDRPVVLSSESLSVKKGTFLKTKMSWKKYIADISVDYINSKNIVEGSTYGGYFANSSKLGEAKTLCKNDLKSFLFSKEFMDCLSSKKSKAKNILGLKKSLKMLNDYAKFDLFVFSNDDTSISYLNGLIICDRQEKENGLAAGKIYVDIEETARLTENEFDVLNSCLNSINNVLPSIVSDLRIEHSSRGEELAADGKTVLKKVDLFSVRGKERPIPLKYESAGIKKIVAICGVLINVYNNQSVALIVDELDSGVFEYLLGLIVRVFDHHAKGQIIFTAHNSRALELLPTKQVIFTSTNPNNRFIKMKKVKPTNNFRDFYYRAILLGGQDEELSPETSEAKIARAFSK